MLVKVTPRATMAPSIRHYSSSRTPLIGEHNFLNPMPVDLFPEYRPLPYVYKIPLFLLAVVCGGGVRKLLAAIQEPRVGAITSFIARTMALYLASYTGIQDFSPRYRPSRISVDQLQERHKILPSKLSRFEPVSRKQQRVHWIQYNNDEAMGEAAILDAAVMFHGFGANSLSWLPSIPLTARKLSIRTCLAHDSPGFGLTDRGNDYTTEGTAAIGVSLLTQQTETSPGRVLLMGHSMGACATLQMALQLQSDPTVESLHVLLVSPVLGRQKVTNNNIATTNQREGLITRCVRPVFSYILRRTVGRPGFWRRGLRQAFVKKLTTDDVLRYQWPSIIQGWEVGLLQWIFRSNPRIGSTLLSQVTKSSKVKTISVVLGKQDRIINPESTRMFLAAFHPTVKVAEVDGAGHDPMEENVDDFVETIEHLVIRSSPSGSNADIIPAKSL